MGTSNPYIGEATGLAGEMGSRAAGIAASLRYAAEQQDKLQEAQKQHAQQQERENQREQAQAVIEGLRPIDTPDTSNSAAPIAPADPKSKVRQGPNDSRTPTLRRLDEATPPTGEWATPSSQDKPAPTLDPERIVTKGVRKYYVPTEAEKRAAKLDDTNSIIVSENEAKQYASIGHPEVKAGSRVELGVHNALRAQLNELDSRNRQKQKDQELSDEKRDKPPEQRMLLGDDGKPHMHAYHPQLGMWAQLPGAEGTEPAAKKEPEMTLARAVTLKVKGTPEEKQFATQWIAEHRAASRDPEAAAERDQRRKDTDSEKKQKQMDAVAKAHDNWQQQEQQQWNTKGAYDQAASAADDTQVVDPRTNQIVRMSPARRKEYKYLAKQASDKAYNFQLQAREIRQRYKFGEFSEQAPAQQQHTVSQPRTSGAPTAAAQAAPSQARAAAAPPKAQAAATAPQKLKASQIAAWAKANGKDPADALKRAKARGLLAE